MAALPWCQKETGKKTHYFKCVCVCVCVCVYVGGGMGRESTRGWEGLVKPTKLSPHMPVLDCAP